MAPIISHSSPSHLPGSVSSLSSAATAWVALTGNPNCGKSTVFNALTGLRAKVGNYAGVTVERKEGRMLETPKGSTVTILDLPGTYSLSPQSLDERIARDVLFQRVAEVPRLHAVVIVIDASNLERNLYYASQVIELGYPVVIALNMVDLAREAGHNIDAQALSKQLKSPVVPLVASRNEGITELRNAILTACAGSVPGESVDFLDRVPSIFSQEVASIASQLRALNLCGDSLALPAALLLISDERTTADTAMAWPQTVQDWVRQTRTRLDAASVDWRSVAIEARYACAAAIHRVVTEETQIDHENWSDRLDRVLTHKLWGMVIFVAIMALMFQGIFSLAQYPMAWIEGWVKAMGEIVGKMIGPGDLRSLLVDGVIAGVGAVIVFLPQICLLFLFIGVLEDSGYMSRAAFLMDRLMSRVGLHGKSFIPMLSSFACAIPGIMATRTIESPRDRLATILVAPLMSCSARLPVYTVLIAACIPDVRWWGLVRLQGFMMLAMYLLGIIGALAMAWLFKRTLLRGEPPLLIMELPPYRRPVPRVLIRHMWERSKMFLRRAGTVILAISIFLWFLSTYPRSAQRQAAIATQLAAIQSSQPPPGTDSARFEKEKTQRLAKLQIDQAGDLLRASFAGKLGTWIEPVLAPLGFDWKIGIGIIASFAAREVFVSTMSTVYNVGQEPGDESGKSLAQSLRAQKRPDGSALYTPLLAVTLMVFYVFALQCVSTLAVVRRETNGWIWPFVQWAYMAVLAWGMAFITWHGGRWLGFS